MDIKFRMAIAEGKFQQMKKLFCDREISIKLRAKTFLQSYVRSRLCYACQAWDLKESEISSMEVKWHGFLRRMINNGFKRKEDSMAFQYSNADLVKMTGTEPLIQYIYEQRLKYIANVSRMENNDIRKQILFAKENPKSRSIWKNFEKQCGIDKQQILRLMMDKNRFFNFISGIDVLKLQKCHVLQ